MISNLPYLLKELTASSCEPDVQAVLTANSPRIVKIRMAVVGFWAVLAVKRALGAARRIKMMTAPANNMNLARLTKPIGKPTDAAKAQTSNSRKLKVVLSKMGGASWFRASRHYL